MLDVINQKRLKDPTAKVCYHDLAPSAKGPPGAFSLTRTNDILYVPLGNVQSNVGDPASDPKEGDQEQPEDPDSTQKKAPGSLQGSAASLVPVTAWKGLSVAGLVWSVKWAPQGLWPIRPQVAMLMDVTLPPKKALIL